MVANDTTASTYRYNEQPTYTTSSGAPINNPEGWQRPGTTGPLVSLPRHSKPPGRSIGTNPILSFCKIST